MAEKTLVSLLIPCYNHEAFLDDCLGSLLAQSYDNIELLVCDDCSPDGSYALLESYRERLAERFVRVEIMRNEQNCGVTKNINRMLSMARGQYVKILASDDAMAPEAIAEMVAFLDGHPEFDVVVSNGIKVSEGEQYPNFTPIAPIYDVAPDFDPDGFFERVAACNPISAPAAMVRRSLYDRYGFYDESVKVEDFEFWLRVLKDRQVRFGYLDRPLLYYRLNANSMTSLTNNADLALRRRRIFLSEFESLNKFKDGFTPKHLAVIVKDRMMAEQWLALEHGMDEWEHELRAIWKGFAGKKHLPLAARLGYGVFRLRQAVKSLQKRRK